MLRHPVWLIMVCLCLPAALVACEQPQQLPPLSTLHDAGLQRLPGLARIIDSTYADDIALFRPPGGASLHVALIDSDHLIVARLDGSDQRTVKPAMQCGSTLAVTPDGMWATCLGGPAYMETDRLEVVSLVAGSSQHYELHLETGDYYGPVWSPDGSHLAVIATNGPETACGVQVYAVGESFTSAELVITFTSDVFTGCDFDALGWSPDGTQLEIATQSSNALLVDEHISIVPPTPWANATVSIPDAQFTSVAIDPPLAIGDTAWNPRTGTLALISSTDGRNDGALRYYPTATRQIGTWLKMPDDAHVLWRITWTPDGRGLVLVITGPYCLDTCIDPPPDAYLYTPLPAGQGSASASG